MHISYRHDEPEVIVKDIGEINLLIEGLHKLRSVKAEAMRHLNMLDSTKQSFTDHDFGIDKIDAMLATMEEVL